MSTAERTTEQDDLEALCRLLAEGRRVTDPDLLRRVRARSAAARQAIRDRHGLVEWAVAMVREARAE